RQRAAFRVGAPDYERRRAALRALLNALVDRREEFVAAVNEDFGGRARQETLALELVPLTDGIRYALRHLASWMKPRREVAALNFLPASTQVVAQPLGVVGVIGAWNYPVLLSLSPVVDALAAGNHVLLKPSELAPRTAELLKDFLGSLFNAEHVAVVSGGAEVAAAFAALPFDHLLFTGSTRVGKLVMRAASEHLTPVTLELGGKSPAIIHREFPLRTAAERILTGKLYNAGQTCLAPDYVLVHESQRDEFLRLAAEVTQQLYPTLAGNPDYTHIINREHYERLAEYLREAADLGARVMPLSVHAEGCNAESRVFVPAAVLDAPDNAQVMSEEIFGPVLPIMTYRELDDALAYVNARPRPLALYYFDWNTSRVERVLSATTSGGVTVNDVIYHIAQNNLPFGGVGASGIGAYHGRTGFETFSHRKAVLVQKRFSALQFIRPPYGAMASRVIKFLLRK
ncbi:MAG TPA: coniferyl aldehyde dehydrogenase, partial [Dongiaceae bacterium]|nr:coniferyl aldehyde dehydrogenase [Dongiaceae bacterium]